MVLESWTRSQTASATSHPSRRNSWPSAAANQCSVQDQPSPLSDLHMQTATYVEKFRHTIRRHETDILAHGGQLRILNRFLHDYPDGLQPRFARIEARFQNVLLRFLPIEEEVLRRLAVRIDAQEATTQVLNTRLQAVERNAILQQQWNYTFQNMLNTFAHGSLTFFDSGAQHMLSVSGVMTPQVSHMAGPINNNPNDHSARPLSDVFPKASDPVGQRSSPLNTTSVHSRERLPYAERNRLVSRVFKLEKGMYELKKVQESAKNSFQTSSTNVKAPNQVVDADHHAMCQFCKALSDRFTQLEAKIEKLGGRNGVEMISIDDSTDDETVMAVRNAQVRAQLQAWRFPSSEPPIDRTEEVETDKIELAQAQRVCPVASHASNASVSFLPSSLQHSPGLSLSAGNASGIDTSGIIMPCMVFQSSNDTGDDVAGLRSFDPTQNRSAVEPAGDEPGEQADMWSTSTTVLTSASTASNSDLASSSKIASASVFTALQRARSDHSYSSESAAHVNRSSDSGADMTQTHMENIPAYTPPHQTISDGNITTSEIYARADFIVSSSKDSKFNKEGGSCAIHANGIEKNTSGGRASGQSRGITNSITERVPEAVRQASFDKNLGRRRSSLVSPGSRLDVHHQRHRRDRVAQTLPEQERNAALATAVERVLQAAGPSAARMRATYAQVVAGIASPGRPVLPITNVRRPTQEQSPAQLSAEVKVPLQPQAQAPLQPQTKAPLQPRKTLLQPQTPSPPQPSSRSEERVPRRGGFVLDPKLEEAMRFEGSWADEPVD